MSSQDKGDLKALDNVSKRLKYLIDTMGVKQSHMAEKLGLSTSGLHYILHNDVKFSKNAKKIAEYLNVNTDWLIKGVGEIHCENVPIKTYTIPIYYPDQLKIYYRSNKEHNLSSDNFAISMIEYKNPSIGIYITETNFSPKFEINDVVIFEQIEKFHDGDIILVYLLNSNILTIKHGFNSGKEIILMSWGEKAIKLARENVVILGNYRECFKKNIYF